MPISKKQKELILKFALQNAVFHNGKADAVAVIGKALWAEAGLRKHVDEVRKEVDKIVKDVNKMPIEKQKEMLEKLEPSMLKKETKGREGLPELPHARKGRVVTRFAPAPTGALHIFHLLRAGFLNYLYAKKYNGKFILRFEDTDPEKVEKEAYDWILQDLKTVGIVPDKTVKQSGRMEGYYKAAGQLIKAGKAYVCTCSQEEFKKIKLSCISCPCRSRLKEENAEKFEKMLSGIYREGDAVLRLKTNMQEPNPVLRDPPIFRIVEKPHPLVGESYKAWPLYNFACAIDDHFLGITHVFRAKEHEHNTAVQAVVFRLFGWKPPNTVNFGMIKLPGGKVHKRDIRKMMESGEISGWDDPKLPTVRAFLRRGFLPETFRQLALMCGLSKTDITISWENLEGINRKVLDPIANRYMAVFNPVKISISGLGEKQVVLNLHPDYPERGKRKVPVAADSICISKDDFEKLNNGKFRLIGLGNIELKDENAKYIGNEIIKEMPKIQWVSEPNTELEIVKAEGVVKGIGEPDMQKLKPGNVIQMERVGFGRVDSVSERKVIIYWAHK